MFTGDDPGTNALESADHPLMATDVVVATLHVYVAPLVNPVTVMGDALPVPTMPPQLTVWFTNVPLPIAPGVKLTETLVLPAAACVSDGADGGMGTVGVTLLEFADHALTPTVVVVLTLQV